MVKVPICDCSDCPAIALRRVDLYGQDFHFCGHHWAELSPVIMAQVSPWDVQVEGGPSGRPREGTMAASGPDKGRR
jgi:hypothetical protein